MYNALAGCLCTQTAIKVYEQFLFNHAEDLDRIVDWNEVLRFEIETDFGYTKSTVAALRERLREESETSRAYLNSQYLSGTVSQDANVFFAHSSISINPEPGLMAQMTGAAAELAKFRLFSSL